MEYIIDSFTKINKYLFGSDIETIKDSIGNNFEEQIEGDIIKLLYTDLSFSFKCSILKEISIIDNGTCVVFFNEIDVFKDRTALDQFSKKYLRVDKYGFIIYDSIGIALSGFIEDEGQRTITVYSKGYWDDLINV